MNLVRSVNLQDHHAGWACCFQQLSANFWMVAGGQQCLQGTQEKGSVMVVMVLPTPRKKKKHCFLPVRHFLLFIMTQTGWLFAVERTGCVSQSSACKPPLSSFDQEQIAADRALGDVVPNNLKRSIAGDQTWMVPMHCLWGWLVRERCILHRTKQTSDCAAAAVSAYLEDFPVNDSQQRDGNSLASICFSVQ